MQVLSVLSHLLDYPSAEFVAAKEDLLAIVNESSISPDTRQALCAFIETQCAKDVMEWQAEYDGLFERGRALGLWLFEHVHGESRDRGQAMIDLIGQYKQAGLELAQNELPDYIPLFLEFLATQGEDNARQWLSEVEHILALLQCRLEKRDSEYAIVFVSLLDIAQSTFDLSTLRDQVNGEKRDDTKQAIDKEWEEEAVTFGAPDADSCPSAVNRPSESQRKDQHVPVTWTDFNKQAS
ncbi:nitrate reductase molybdenum cofactor assembly chaperone [Pseudoalteromonas rubra]|uniref:Nitrate reductase molybdenum cofactor assembly chaperone n=1 Tax=Pseudoalteromonas rubra TaxID=43658 RepID=A0A5S3WNR2_9GAMM|nr:nitrate reductase molybdenum cofactor assembly chaperone [Pseudoalteromonas rubra]TMP29067.1 nitrate reductase molybdenum cofactor assembly chaperone [Pseudoalteromonas rubra]TMP33568.1 nitrate reductase molybdenum cofactor assembly chaperone [Pseudoalteromonas rubra]